MYVSGCTGGQRSAIGLLAGVRSVSTCDPCTDRCDWAERERRWRGACAWEEESRIGCRRSGSRCVDPDQCRPPARLAAGREGLDDDHTRATARAWVRQHARGVRRNIWLLLRVGGRWGDIEECAGRGDAFGAVGGGKEPVVADAVEALGQHVQQEAPDELVRLEPHRLPAIGSADAIVLPTERNRLAVGRNEAAV